MRQHISVNQAIIQGHLMVNVPVFIVIIGIPSLSYYLTNQNLIPEWSIIIGLIIGFIMAWLIWSVMITKWRVWAFENVQHVHELKKRAIDEKLIWHDGSIFEKTEIRTAEEKQKLKNLKRRFATADVFREDYSVPKRTLIYYSKSDIYFEIGISILLICVGIFLVSFTDNMSLFLGSFSILIGIYFLITRLKHGKRKEPQIIIDSNGIETISTEFTSWDLIYDEEVIQEGFGKSSSSYLQYFFDDSEIEKIKIDELNISARRLENIVRTYRIRYNKNYR